MFDYPHLNEAASLRLKHLIRQRVRVRIEDSHAPLVVIYLAEDVFALQGDEAAQLIVEAEILEENFDLYRCDALLLAAADFVEAYAGGRVRREIYPGLRVFARYAVPSICNAGCTRKQKALAGRESFSSNALTHSKRRK